MQTQHVQLTLYLPDDLAQPAVAVPCDDGNREKPLTIREAAHAYTRRVRDMPAAEQPVARLVHYGAHALSTAELLAILLATPHAITDAEHILGQFGSLPGLAQCTIDELTATDGLGDATAARIKAALELGRRLLVAAPADRPQMRFVACGDDSAGVRGRCWQNQHQQDEDANNSCGSHLSTLLSHPRWIG